MELALCTAQPFQNRLYKRFRKRFDFFWGEFLVFFISAFRPASLTENRSRAAAVTDTTRDQMEVIIDIPSRIMSIRYLPTGKVV